jgi:P4 family phage/plasmid primase-like protien
LSDEKRTENSQLVKDLVKKIRDTKNIYFKNKHLIPNLLAGDIVFDDFNPKDFSGMNRGFIVLNSKDKDIYVYNDGVYHENGEDIIRCVARMIMENNATNQRVTEVVTAVKQMTALYIEINQLNNYTNLINLRNGIYNTDNGELLEHDKKYFFTIQLEIAYDKDAKCERFIQFLSEIHNTEDIPLIQELFGYALYPKYEFHKIVFCIGTGRNGKGTEQSVLTALVGHKNVTSTSLKQIVENPFMSAQLHNKLINICGEISEAKIFDTAILKALAGGDAVTGQHKNKQPFDFINYAKIIISCNKAPDIEDDTTALWHRMMVIDYPYEFLDTNPKTDPKLREKLSTPEELAGIFIWAMNGLKRLKGNGKFTYNKTPIATKKHYDTLRNHVILFAEKEKINNKSDMYIPKNKLYKEYKDWCHVQNPPIKPYNPIAFSKKLFEAVLGCTSDKIQINGKRVNVYMDIAYDDFSKMTDVYTYWDNKTEESNQKKLDISITLEDKLNSLKVLLEDNPLTEKEIINNGIEKSIFDECVKRGIIIKRPDERYELNI